MAISKELYTQEIDATMTILQMCIIIDKYIRQLIDEKEEKTDVTDKLKAIQEQIDLIKTNVQNNTDDIATHNNAIVQLNTQITALNNLLANYKELNPTNLQDLIKGSDDITVDLDPTQEHLIIKLDQDIKDELTNLDNNVTTLLSDVADNTTDINNIKSPIAPIAIDNNGKLYLNFGSGLEVDNGKLKSTGGTTINSYSTTGIYNYKFIYSINDGNDNKIVLPPMLAGTTQHFKNGIGVGNYTTIPIGNTIVSGPTFTPLYFYNDNDTSKKIPVGIDYRKMNNITGDYTDGGFIYDFMLPYLEYENKYNTVPIKYKMETIDYEDPTGGIASIEQPRLYLEYNEADFSVDTSNGKLQLNTPSKKYVNWFSYTNTQYGIYFDMQIISDKKLTSYTDLFNYCVNLGTPYVDFAGNGYYNKVSNKIYSCFSLAYFKNDNVFKASIYNITDGELIRVNVNSSQISYAYSYEI